MVKVIHPSMGILSPAADTSLSDDGVVFASVEKLAATLSSMSEIEDPESSIILSTSLLFNTLHVTAALGWTAAVTTPADLAGLSSWNSPSPSGTSLGSFLDDSLEKCVQTAHTNYTLLLKGSSFVNGLVVDIYSTQQLGLFQTSSRQRGHLLCQS